MQTNVKLERQWIRDDQVGGETIEI